MQKFKQKAANSLRLFNARISDSSLSSSTSSILPTAREKKRATTIHELLGPSAVLFTPSVRSMGSRKIAKNETNLTVESDDSEVTHASSRIAKFDIAGIELKNYEKVKLVGQGSFGIAVLYKRRTDNVLVVFKQINLGDLSPIERDLAMNEVEVFSKLHHPNVISYFGSFIKGRTLLIEMEYADAGTLAQIVAERKIHDYFPERYILAVFEQISSAINYIHQQNILHRDLKTANMFLNKRGIVKVGDFGISKIMNTKLQTQTVLGTPYYFSPEMCEGKDYNHKSDIWALGCILGEMCCLQKAFAASNLSQLISKIMMGAYTPLPQGYSSAMKGLLDNLLQIDPSRRPDASEILEYWIPLIHRNLGKNKGHSYEETIALNTLQALSTSNRNEAQTFDGAYAFNVSTKTTIVDLSTAQTNIREIMNTSLNISNAMTEKRSVLYQLQSFGQSFTMNPIQLPPRAVIESVATSGTHFIVVNNDGSVYAWGEGSRGQLGAGKLEAWKHYPNRLETGIYDQRIIRAGAGDGFTILLSQNGKLFSCGDNADGALAQPETKIYHHPKLIEYLLDEQITDIQVGSSHVMALSANGAVYTWGSSTLGALGLGALQIKQMQPKKVISSSSKNRIKEIICGPDVSAVLWEKGDVSVCGSNQFNKLGFNNKITKVMTLRKLLLTELKSHRIVSIKFSATHTVLLVDDGYVFTMGCNASGQHALGHTKPIQQITLVESLKKRYIVNCKCCDHYTIVCSDDNVVTYWGKRYGIPDVVPTTLETQFSSSESGNMDTMTNTKIFTSNLTSIYKSELLLQPQDLLALYSSAEQMAKGYYVRVKDIYPLAYSVLVLVDTSVPLAASLQDIS